MVATDTRIYETRFGPMLAFAADRYITGSLEAYGEYCPGEWALLAQLVKPGMTVVEVGANIGTHSVPLARACAPAPIYLFEPQQRVFQLLCANLAMNGVTNAIALPEACSDAEGVVVAPPVDYARSGNVGGVKMEVAEAGAAGQRIRAVTLDSLELAACGLIKVDAEGFEPRVLRGAAGTIARHRPLLYVENDRAAHQQEVISQIAAMGYRLYWHTPPLFQPDNFRGATQNIFGARVVSMNMLCLPAERGTVVQDQPQIDPDNWTSPVKLQG